MKFTGLSAALAALALSATAALAQPYPPPPPGDPNGYYNPNDPNGYYDQNGVYRHIPAPSGYDGPPPPPPPPPGYYAEQNCHRGNAAAGTVFGALAGGLIGGAVTHGAGGAVVGGAVLGGLFGNAVSQDIDCDDQPYAFRVYDEGLNGDIGRRYEWNHGDVYGYFTPTREYHRGGVVCRDFTETTFRHGEAHEHEGTACRQDDGNWRFD